MNGTVEEVQERIESLYRLVDELAETRKVLAEAEPTENQRVALGRAMRQVEYHRNALAGSLSRMRN